MWTPNSKEAQVKMLCHGGATRAVAVDLTGRSVQHSLILLEIVIQLL